MPKVRSKTKLHQTVIPVEDIAKEDINFPEFCFGVIGKVPLKDQPDELVFVDKINPDAQITVSKSRYGLPTQFTRDLRLALMRIGYRKNRFKSRQTPASAGEILAEMGLTHNGKNLSILKKHLDILTGTRIKFNHSFFDKEQSKQIDKTIEFGILSGYEIVEFKSLKGKKKSDDPDNLIGKFMWSDYFYDNSVQNAKNLIDMDYAMYTQLEGDITKQLYSFLNKRSYGRDVFRIELQVLAFEKLGLSRNNSMSKVRFALKKSHKSLMEAGFLKREPEFTKSFDGKEYAVYNFSQTYSLPENQEVLPIADSRFDDLKHRLQLLEFTEGQIGKLFKEYPTESITDALDMFDLENTNGKIKSPRKWILACLSRGFDTSNLEEKRKESEEARLALAKEQEQLEEEGIRAAEKARTAEENKKKIDLWIGENPAKYYTKCQEFYKDLEETNNTIFLDLIKREVKKSGTSEVEVIMANAALSSMVRGKIEL